MSIKVSKFILALLAIEIVTAEQVNESIQGVILADFKNSSPTVIPPSAVEAKEPEKKEPRGRRKSDLLEDFTELNPENETGRQKEPLTFASPTARSTTTRDLSTVAPTPSKTQGSGKTSYVSNRYITIYPTVVAPRLKGEAVGSMKQTLLFAAAPILAFALAFIW